MNTKYKWGVEYAVNGEIPDLPSDVVIKWKSKRGLSNICNVGELHWAIGLENEVVKFTIIDGRYKPKDYPLNEGDILRGTIQVEKLNKNDWHDRWELPPVGSVCAFYKNKSLLFNDEIDERWLDGDELEVLAHRIAENGEPVAVVWNVRDKYSICLVPAALKPLQFERDKVIETAMQVCNCRSDDWTAKGIMSDLYNAGMLKLPEEN